jgi:hypothetical protein
VVQWRATSNIVAGSGTAKNFLESGLRRTGGSPLCEVSQAALLRKWNRSFNTQAFVARNNAIIS